MQNTLTPKQKAELLAAVEQAQGYGQCSYKQGCVVAQLYHMNDIPIPPEQTDEEDRDLDGMGVDYLSDTNYELPPYPVDLMVGLQRYWDGSPEATPVDEARVKMRQFIQEWTDHEREGKGA